MVLVYIWLEKWNSDTGGAFFYVWEGTKIFVSLQRKNNVFCGCLHGWCIFVLSLTKESSSCSLSLTDDNNNNLSYTIYQVHISCILVIILHHIIFKTETYYGQWRKGIFFIAFGVFSSWKKNNFYTWVVTLPPRSGRGLLPTSLSEWYGKIIIYAVVVNVSSRNWLMVK